MTGIWTPGGEVHPEPASNDAADSTPAEISDVFEGMSEEEKQAALQQISQMRTELLATPARDVIGNHIVGFYELASVHLSEAANSKGTDREARLAEASLCIDAMGAVVEGLGDRLDKHSEPLKAALSQMRMAFIQVKNGETTSS